jgi:hypothetical protein
VKFNVLSSADCGISAISDGIIDIARRSSATLFFRVINRYERSNVANESANTPPRETTDAKGESIWLNAILVHENPPKGRRAFISSINRRAKISAGRFEVKRARTPMGIK